MRIIPKKTKVTTELFKGVSILDVIIGMLGAMMCIAVLTSNLPYKLWIVIGVLAFFVFLLMPMDDEKVYMFVYHLLLHLARPSRVIGKGDKQKPSDINVNDITPFTGVEDEFICYNGEYFATVIEIPSIEFRFFSESRQNSIIDRNIGAVLRTISGAQTGALVKIDRPVIYDDYIETEKRKIAELKQAFLEDVINEFELTERIGIIYDRISEINRINFADKVYRPFHYLVFFEEKKPILSEQTKNAMVQIRAAGMIPKQLTGKELAIFLKYQYTQIFDEREVDKLTPDEYMNWILPEKIEFGSRQIKYDGLVTHTLKVLDYPMIVGNAWGHKLFNMPNTRVVMKFKPVERYQSIRRIDRAIEELRGQYSETGKASRLMEINEHISSLAELLSTLQSENETLFDTNTYVTIYDYELTQRYRRQADAAAAAAKEKAERERLAKEAKQNKNKKSPKTEDAPAKSAEKPDEKKNESVTANQSKESTTSSQGQYVSLKKKIKRSLSEAGFKTQDLFIQTFDAYASSHISAFDSFGKKSRGIHSSSIAASFPFVYPFLKDKDGMCFGTTGGNPVFVNFFQRDTERVNSNMVIIGKSGSGKSFATKTVLSNLAADNSKIFILDPENEYGVLAKKLGGKMIDVGKATEGNLNPFHIITAVSDDEEESVSNSFNAHLQFLEEYFRTILPGVDNDSLEYLNNLLPRLYADKDIDQSTDLSSLKAEDYPIFDDLYDKILTDFQLSNSEYSKKNLRILLNYISKFSSGGRNSHLWNAPSSIDTAENFIVFNFQSLLANRNNIIANAQMMLVLKYLDNEIIKNRDYNIMNHADRKIVIVIDEAHVFIDEKYPIALDFMYQLAKRIRKYNGMQIIITQNIKDFVGTEELARKSTAIINACQYSFIFPLAPNDMHDLCKLYEKAGGINESEQEQIINNPRGRAFVVTSPSSRTCVDIVATKDIQSLFTE